MSVFGIIFWLWLTVSMVVFVGRRVKGRARARAVPAAPDGPAVVDPGSRSMIEPTPVAPDPVEGPTAGPRGSTEGPARVDGPATPIDDTMPPPRPSADVGPPALRSSLSIADALSGIEMPCDLAPLTLGSADLDATRIDFVTSGVGAAEVTAQLDAELARLGYAIDDLGGGERLSTRDDVVVRVRVHDRPAVSVAADGRGFPTAPPDSIVVELAVASR